jgi:mRNA interferase YafQ
MRTLVASTAFRKTCGARTGAATTSKSSTRSSKSCSAAKALPPSNRAHPLKGEWKGYWDCHVAPDWVLIYKLTEDELRLARTGTHADLFER